MEIKRALNELNKELVRRKKTFTLYTCGGAAKKYVLREQGSIETYEIFVDAVIRRLAKNLGHDDD